MAKKHKMSKSELERDSGLSDVSSGYFSAVDQSEFEDIRSSSSSTKNKQSVSPVPLVPESFQDVSAMVKMNNTFLKQSNPVNPALKAWGFNPSLEVIPPTPVVLLQPIIPSSNYTSQSSTNPERQCKKYIPILNSFLKIAPHPVHEATVDAVQRSLHKGSTDHSHAGKHRHGQKRSQGLSLKQDISEATTVGSHSADSCVYNHSFVNMRSSPKLTDLQELNASTAFLNCTDCYSPLSEGNPIYDSSGEDDKSIPASLSHSPSKRKRFCNTYNILNRSGLLGITMRTKELIRQNKRSQAQLQKLQAHTDLFLEAMSSRDPHIWAKLQLTLKSPGSEESKQDTVGSMDIDGTAIGCM
ncbi:CLOCK-interacting pacemaker a [Hoplias malabaricus]|uniref:CLOCK-interacting pacemaker a n=1 Tax=Hoplias malabaricus TaxID=27720 RepID=UPI003461D1E7